MLEAHLPLLLAVVLSIGLGVVLMSLSNFLGPRRPSKVKLEAFECGNPPTGPARDRFNVKFYLVAILFLVFDLEAVFVYPWAVVFSDAAKGKTTDVSPWVAVGSMLFFAGLLVVSLIYEWRKGALEWSHEREIDEARAAAALPPSHDTHATQHGHAA